EVLAVELLLREEALRERFELRAALLEHPLRVAVAGPQDLELLLAHQALDLRRVRRAVRPLPEEADLTARDQREVWQTLAHAVDRDHVARDPARLLDVVGGAGRDHAERELLGGATAHERPDAAEQLLVRHQIAVLERRLQRVAEGAAAARHDRDLLYR